MDDASLLFNVIWFLQFRYTWVKYLIHDFLLNVRRRTIYKIEQGKSLVKGQGKPEL
jgi:hypothetical protein